MEPGVLCQATESDGGPRNGGRSTFEVWAFEVDCNRGLLNPGGDKYDDR